MAEYSVQKTFNKYSPGDVETFPNELVGPNEVEKLLKDGHITLNSEPEPEEKKATKEEPKDPKTASNKKKED